MLNLWQILPAVSAVVAGGCVFAFPKDVKGFHKYMGFTLIFDGLWIMLATAVRFSFSELSLPLYYLSLAMMLITPFFYYLSCRYLLKEEGVKKSDLWMLEAIVVFLVASIVVTLQTTFADRTAFACLLRGDELSSLSTGTSVLISMDNMALILFLIEFAVTIIFYYFGLKEYAKKVQDYYSEMKSTYEICLLCALMTIKIAAFAATIFAPGLSEKTWILASKAILDTLFYAAAAYLAINTIFTSEEIGKSLKASEAKEGKLPAADEIIAGRLERLIEEKFYVNPETDIFSLSETMHINAKYIADYIRYHYGASFMVFVNKLRVEYSIELMKDAELNLLAISDESGFITPSTFYRNFTKIMGVSPSEYRKKL